MRLPLVNHSRILGMIMEGCILVGGLTCGIVLHNWGAILGMAARSAIVGAVAPFVVLNRKWPKVTLSVFELTTACLGIVFLILIRPNGPQDWIRWGIAIAMVAYFLLIAFLLLLPNPNDRHEQSH
jgi:hypothetical protein